MHWAVVRCVRFGEGSLYPYIDNCVKVWVTRVSLLGQSSVVGEDKANFERSDDGRVN